MTNNTPIYATGTYFQLDGLEVSLRTLAQGVEDLVVAIDDAASPAYFSVAVLPLIAQMTYLNGAAIGHQSRCVAARAAHYLFQSEQFCGPEVDRLTFRLGDAGGAKSPLAEQFCRELRDLLKSRLFEVFERQPPGEGGKMAIVALALDDCEFEELKNRRDQGA